MIIKIEQTKKKKKTEKLKKSKQPRKQRKAPTVKVGTHKKLTFVLWVLPIGSVSFGIYKNVTTTDTHIIHKIEIIERQVINTNQVERFVESFTEEYFSRE